MKISIVIAYYNRRNLFIKTLESISNTQYKGDLEIIVVDDASLNEHKIDDLPNLFPKLNLKIIQIDAKNKWWVNPCIPNNIGFEIASGDVIIIQNPECLHIGDIVSYTAKNINTNKYIVFGCYAINEYKTNLMGKINGGSIEDIDKIINPINYTSMNTLPGTNSWYQHSKLSNHCLNFCSSITKHDLNDLGGFDEAFANGIGCDDTEFITRIRRKGMCVDAVDIPFVIHQHHGYTDYSNTELVVINHNLRINTMEKNNTFRVFNKHTKKLVKNII